MKEILVYTIVSDNIIPGKRVFVTKSDPMFAHPDMFLFCKHVLTRTVSTSGQWVDFANVLCWNTLESLLREICRNPAAISFNSKFPVFLDEPRANEVASEMIGIGAKVAAIIIPVTPATYKRLVDAARIRGAYRFLETMKIMATSSDF